MRSIERGGCREVGKLESHASHRRYGLAFATGLVLINANARRPPPARLSIFCIPFDRIKV